MTSIDAPDECPDGVCSIVTGQPRKRERTKGRNRCENSSFRGFQTQQLESLFSFRSFVLSCFRGPLRGAVETSPRVDATLSRKRGESCPRESRRSPKPPVSRTTLPMSRRPISPRTLRALFPPWWRRCPKLLAVVQQPVNACNAYVVHVVNVVTHRVCGYPGFFCHGKV